MDESESETGNNESSEEEEPQEEYFSNIIPEVEDESIANVFCFGAFTDKMTGVVYNDCTGNFPFMSLDGNVCFLVMYHYETNAIFAIPISGLDSKSILEAYKNTFEYLVTKGINQKSMSWTISNKGNQRIPCNATMQTSAGRSA